MDALRAGALGTGATGGSAALEERTGAETAGCVEVGVGPAVVVGAGCVGGVVVGAADELDVGAADELDVGAADEVRGAAFAEASRRTGPQATTAASQRPIVHALRRAAPRRRGRGARAAAPPAVRRPAVMAASQLGPGSDQGRARTLPIREPPGITRWG